MDDKGEGRVKILKKWETSFMDGPLKMTCDHKVSALVFWLKKFVIHNAPDFVQNEYIIHNIYSNIFCLFYRNGILICQKKWEVFGAVCDISKFHFCKTNRKYCSTIIERTWTCNTIIHPHNLSKNSLRAWQRTLPPKSQIPLSVIYSSL